MQVESDVAATLAQRLGERLRELGYDGDPVAVPPAAVAQALCNLFGSSVRVVADADDDAVRWLPASIRSHVAPPEFEHRAGGDVTFDFCSTEVCRWTVRIGGDGSVSYLVLPIF